MRRAEFDCRGTVKVHGNVVMFDIAELKSGVGRTLALTQILKRLSLLNAGAEKILESDRGVVPFTIQMNGLIVTATSSWIGADTNEITSMIKNLHLSVSAGCVSIEFLRV